MVTTKKKKEVMEAIDRARGPDGKLASRHRRSAKEHGIGIAISAMIGGMAHEEADGMPALFPGGESSPSERLRSPGLMVLALLDNMKVGKDGKSRLGFEHVEDAIEMFGGDEEMSRSARGRIITRVARSILSPKAKKKPG